MENGQKWTETDSNRHKWTETDREGQKLGEKTERNTQKHTVTDRNGQKWTETDTVGGGGGRRPLTNFKCKGTDGHIARYTDTATYRLNRPRGPIQ